ncbi:hypothetical protein B0T10DRAFT_561058 [Thelonectria olida]|uniref:Extracellular serine-rich protein n=1 Tax=Thelonectria olida TaxID=1576542 RepID=A0A9P8W6J3_9HYPO|nr:hypothetical protein B0T10DRAFT_561058 [Thelonectria olida]
MLPKSLLAVSFLLTRAWAQSSSTATVDEDDISTTAEASATAKETETGTSTATGVTTHTIAVGASGHKFTPDEVTADIGDVIEWRFYPPNHWVIRGDFDNPCIPYEYVGTDREGFSSGEQSVQAITDDGPRFRVRVNNTDPIFFYCGAPGSCVRYHMMGVVNPSKNETLDEWVSKADDVDYQLRPGDPWPSEADFTKPTDAVTSETGSSSNDNDGDDDNHHGGHGLSAGAIAGIAIGAAAVLLLAGGLLYLCGRRGGFDKAYRKSFRNSAAPSYAAAPPGVVETRFDSPNTPATSMWTGQKQPSPMSAYAQSPPMSPQNTAVGYNYQPGFNPMMAQEGTMGSYYSDQGHTPQHLAVPHQAETPKPAEQIAPVELPGSHDPGNSPLPDYDNTQSDGQQRTFSWAGEETAYRPAK